jgi:threonine dehydratase
VENAGVTDRLITLAEITAAAARIAPYVQATPLIAMTPTGVRLKAESLHPIGAFKIRGAFNALLLLSEAERARGVIAYSSGNHAQAVSYAAHVLGVKAIIVMPADAPAAKLAGTRRWGAEVITTSAVSAERRAMAEALATERGLALIPPFNAFEIIAGTGTIGLEILAAFDEVELIAVPVSGGGLVSGVAAAVKLSRPDVRVIAVEPELANDAAQSFRTGVRVEIPAAQAISTIADGLRVQQLGEITWPHVRAFVDDVVTVSEDQIKAAVRQIAAEARLIAEPSGAVALAGVLAMGARPETAAAVLSGGNVDADVFAGILLEG